ncbi:MULTISPECIES: myo-inosose-2 dehydratase [unclassified Marinobacterium]|uniref:myo-inosose-2 dehydratase n=1 Tax=unclassified Marinobacterium TaxID=2644139 RepID=UPI001569B3E1|nr:MULTISPECIES: myo-inosose-2 dehydratase [unclassified Marinobacterium]NRP53285.1 Inosose dehydratase [Marinobacterium sp. xm-v-242]NRP78070.1 Inosose dehydratase [Marinobacterium sp. xm-m-383]
MSVRIGINPLTWTNDDMPELGADTPLETCLSEGKEAGYAGFELGQKFPRKAEVLGPILDAHGLKLVSGWYSSQLLERTAEEEIEAMQDHMNLLKALGSNVMVYCEVSQCIHGEREVPVSKRPVMTDAEWTTLLERIEVVGQYLQSQGMALAYHHHMGTVVESEADVDRLMQGTSDAVGLLLDTGHMTYAGGDPLALAKRYAGRIRHVHCKDIRAEVLKDAKNQNLSFLNSVLNGTFTVPGDGSVDYPSIFAVLKECNYSGWLVVEAEQDPAVAHPLTYAKLGYANLTKLCADAGLEVSV